MTNDMNGVPVDELVQRRIYDPAAPDADRQLELIKSAISLGATIDDLQTAGGEVSGLITRFRLGVGPSRYTVAEAADKAGVSLNLAKQLSLAMGFGDSGPDARTLDDSDVELFQIFRAAEPFFGADAVMQLARLIGASTARMADAFISALVSTFITNMHTHGRPGPVDEQEVRLANETAIGMLPMAVRAIELMLQRHIVLRTRSQMPTPDDWEGVDTLDRAVGFCDVVGYTALSGKISTTELAGLLADFENLAADLITRLKGNVIKLIGDEVMFVAADPAAACEIALALVESFAAHPTVPAVRIGLSSGRVIMREGDYFGPTVNLAARIVKLAPEGAVIAPASFRDAPRFTYEDAGAPQIKGFSEPIGLVLIRR